MLTAARDIKAFALAMWFDTELEFVKKISNNIYGSERLTYNYYILTKKELHKVCKESIRANSKNYLLGDLQFLVSHCNEDVTYDYLLHFIIQNDYTQKTYDTIFGMLKDKDAFVSAMIDRVGAANLIASVALPEWAGKIDGGHFYLINELLEDLKSDPMINAARDCCRDWNNEGLHVFCDWLIDQKEESLSNCIRTLLNDCCGNFYIFRLSFERYG